ncbi:MAG: T9SS type A sorting domain-containing protein, partial [Bacteroidota bacterium]
KNRLLMTKFTSTKCNYFSFQLLLFFMLTFYSFEVFSQVSSDDNGITQNLQSSNTFSFTIPPGDDRLLVVCTQGSTVSGVTFDGNSMTKAVDETIMVGNEDANVALYYYAASSDNSATTGDIVVSGTVLSGAVASSYSNVEQGLPITDIQKTSTSGATVTSSNLTVNSSTGDMVCDCLGIGQVSTSPNNPTATADVSQTEIGQQLTSSQTLPNINIAALAAVSRENGATSVSMDWNVGNLETGAYGLIHVAMNIGQIPTQLPVELMSFDVRKQDEKVYLNWKTASELDNAGFEIQRSTDGVSFERIHFVEGNGTVSQENAYQFVDEAPAAGWNYYRLKQMDFSGTFEYSKVQSVLLENDFEAKLDIYPNPTTRENVWLEFSSPSDHQLWIEVFDTAGKLLLQQQQMAAAGENKIELNLDTMGQGYYILRLRSDQVSYFRKLIIE